MTVFLDDFMDPHQDPNTHRQLWCLSDVIFRFGPFPVGQRFLIQTLMEECQKVGEAVGAKFNVSIENRINGAASIIGHKPSTRQDIELKRPLEIDPIMSVIIEIGAKLNIPTPMLKHVNGILKLKADYLGLYKRNKLIDKLTV